MKKNIIIFFTLLGLSTPCFSQVNSLKNEYYKKKFVDSNLILDIEDNKKNIDFISKKILSFKEKEGSELFSLMMNIHIEAKRKTNFFENNSITNGNYSDCKIVLSYQPVEFTNKSYQADKKVLFSLTHELSHCLLGKEVFKGEIFWEININDEQKKNITEKILNQSAKSWIAGKNNEKVFNPLISYHETFADTFTILYLYKNNILNKKDIVEIIEMRKNDCANKDFCHYYVFEHKDEIIKFMDDVKKNQISIDNIFTISNLLANKTLIEKI